ncbi:MAG: DUF861 domain-containing protein [Bacteroidetes bacterium]|jgi:uncharacterized cupin superfamily protein|nr:DUF861 domain-containing protein [Bacteroidota bacterium]
MKSKTPSAKEIEEAQKWGTWEKEPSQFPWFYDQHETCYILEGEATIKDKSGKEINIKKGDWVDFPKGLSCEWEIRKHLRKKYKFI